MNDFERFCQDVLVEAEMRTGKSLQISKVLKNNDEVLTAIRESLTGPGIVANVYLEPFYELWLQGKTSFFEIISMITEKLDEPCALIGVEPDFFADFEQVKDRICYRLLSLEKNKVRFKEDKIVYRPWLDLAMVYVYDVPEAREVGEFASITITKGHIKRWGVTEQDLYELACKNTPDICGSNVMDLSGLLMKLAVERDIQNLIEDIRENEAPPMVVCTNKDMTFGATAILYSKELKAVSERLGDVYVIPSSVHECIFLPIDGMDRDALDEMIRAVNCHCVRGDEVLADHAYLYRNGEFSIPAVA